MNALEMLEDWKNGGHGKGRDCQIWHDNSYGATDGWHVQLRYAGIREINVNGYTIMKSIDDDNDEWPTLDVVIIEAIRQWNEKG